VKNILKEKRVTVEVLHSSFERAFEMEKSAVILLIKLLKHSATLFKLSTIA